MNRLKIIATIGPKSNNIKSLKSLIRSGASIFRLNGSHANLDWHTETIKKIRLVSKDVPILFDIPGSKTRLAELKKPVEVKKNSKIFLTINKKDTEKLF